MLTNAAVHAALDAIDLDEVSLHSAYSATGANEASGGSYARQAATYAAAASRARALSGTESFTGLAAAQVVAWIGRWSTTGPTFLGMDPNGASPKAFQLDLTNNRVYCEGHGFANGDRVTFYGGTPPTGITVGAHLYVVGVTAGDPDYFQVSTTEGGAAIDITGQHGAGCVVSPITIETFAGAGGTFNLTADSISIPGTV
jgi:hypothetical protein